jgi:HEAT repeat protein
MKIFTCSLFIICTTRLLFGQDISAHIEALAGEDAAARLESRDAIFAAFAKATAPRAAGDDSTMLETAALSEIKGSMLPLSERLYLLRMVERFGSDAVAEGVYPLLGDTSPHIRDSARRVLVALPGKQAEAFLLTGLKRCRETERIAYIDALVEHRAIAAAPAIAVYLESSRPVVTAVAAVALGKLGNPVVIPQLLAARESCDGIVLEKVESAMLQIGLELNPAVELAQNGSTGSIRAEAFGQLIQLDAHEAEKRLREVLSDAAFLGRLRFIEKGLQSDSPALHQLIIPLLKDGEASDKIVIVTGVGAAGLGQYEAVLLGLFPGADSMLRTAIIRALGNVGGEESFRALFDAYIVNRKDESLKEALAKVQAPQSDAKALSVLKEGTESQDRIAAMEVLELRNIGGATELINKIAIETGEVELREAAFKTLESIGDEASLRLLLDFISKGQDSVAAAQRSLKRFSLNFGDPKYQWEKFYEPALKLARDNATKGSIVEILDCVACPSVVVFLKQELSDAASELREAALQSLRRWPVAQGDEVAGLWILIAEADFSTDQERSLADRALRKLLTQKGHQYNIGQADLIVKIAKSNLPREFKRGLLGIYKNPAKHFEKRSRPAVIRRLKPILQDPDLGDSIKQIIDSL